MQNLSQIIKRGFLAPKPIQFLLVGAPGEGKTALIRQVSEDIGAALLVLTPAIDEPTDYKGLPCNVGGKAEFLPFGNLDLLLNWDGGKSGVQLLVALIDDAGQASEMVQAALMPLLQGGEINGQRIANPHLIRFIAATNDVAGNNGVGGLLEPLKNRFHSIINYKATVKEWTFVALAIGIADEIVAYLNYRPDMLTRTKADFDPCEIVNFPSPRTWERLSDLMEISNGLSSADRLELFAGAVGRGTAIEFCAFLESSQDFPTALEVAQNPMGARLPDDMALYFAMSIMLLKNVNSGNLDAFLTYLKRFKKREVLTFWLQRVVKSIALETQKSGKKGAKNWFFSHHVCNDELVLELLPVLMAAN